MRVFVCLEIPEEIKKLVKKIQEELPYFKGKKTEEENLHLTLKFLGEIDEIKLEKVKEKLSQISLNKFRARIEKIGVFDKNFIRIIWLKIENCEDLQKKVDEKLSELFEKEKRFMSHLTIARVKSVSNKDDFLKKIEKIEFPKKEFEINNFYLKKSILQRTGPLYENIERYELK